MIRKLIRDLNLPVRVAVLPTVREEDGLAMSSRNAYLDGDERARRRAVARATAAEREVAAGSRDAAQVLAAARAELDAATSSPNAWNCVPPTTSPSRSGSTATPCWPSPPRRPCSLDRLHDAGRHMNRTMLKSKIHRRRSPVATCTTSARSRSTPTCSRPRTSASTSRCMSSTSTTAPGSRRTRSPGPAGPARSRSTGRRHGSSTRATP